MATMCISRVKWFNAQKILLTKSCFFRFIVCSALVYLSVSNYYLSQKAKLVPASSTANSKSQKLVKPIRVYKSSPFLLQNISPMNYEIFYRNGKCARLVSWIVTTWNTTEEPRENNIDFLLKYGSHSFCILVLAVNDHKTPKWVRHKRVIYLTPKRQSLLPFELAKLSITSESHSKNIGFLYAIQNGAETIMDLNRNYIPVKMKSGKCHPILPIPSIVNVPRMPESYNKKYWDPSTSPVPIEEGVLYENRICIPQIQMYTVLNKEDFLLDAVSIPPSMYSTYPSHASVYWYGSFWSLLLPQALKHAHQWRSLLAQHHLHQFPGTCVTFLPPAIKPAAGSLASHQKDVLSQETLPKIFDILDNSPHYSFFKLSLYWSYIHLYEYGLAEEQDIDYSKAWLTDLVQLKYTFPSRKQHINSWTSNVQLCIMFNLMKMKPNAASINMILRYYSHFFPRILVLFDGEWPNKPKFIPSSVYFSGCKSENGKLQHICLNKCMHSGKKRASGYLYIADDMFVNFTMMSTLSPYKIWYIKPFTINYTSVINDEPTDWHWGPPDYYEYALKTVIDSLPTNWMNQLSKNSGFPEKFSIRGIFDIIYIPAAYVDQLTDVLSHIISTVDLFCELAGPLAVEILAPQSERETLIYGYLWHEKRTMDYIRETAMRASFVHPLKLAKNYAEARLWQQLMDQQLFSLLDRIY